MHQPETCVDGEKRTIGRPKKQRSADEPPRTGQGKISVSAVPIAFVLLSLAYHPPPTGVSRNVIFIFSRYPLLFFAILR